MKKKILFMINSMDVGGAEKSLSSLLSLFDYEQYDVYLQMINFGGVFEKQLPQQIHILPQLPYYEFCKRSFKKQLISGNFRFLKARFAVHRELVKNANAKNPLHATQAFWAGAKDAFDMLLGEYDVAIAWGQGTPTHFIAEKVNARKKIAWINANYEAAGHNKSFDIDIYGKYACIVGVSEKLSDKLKMVFSEYKNRIITIYDIISNQLIQKMAEEVFEVPLLHGTIINTVGRLVEQKGYDIAIEAAHILKEIGVDFTWLVCGEGNERRKLEKMIREYGLENDFILLGVKANPYPYMKAADIYVQTSRSEGFCMTLTEARILNRPCVTTDFDVVYDQIIDGENGLVVEMTAEGIADGIIRLIQDKELYKHIQLYQMTEKKGNEEEIYKLYEIM